ncbi:hypothetical protein R6Q59_032843 [Mikania micrantha]
MFGLFSLPLLRLPLARVVHSEEEHSPTDVQSVYQNYEEVDDEFEDEDLITKQNFKNTCDMCGLGIDWYHRYHYKQGHNIVKTRGRPHPCFFV